MPLQNRVLATGEIIAHPARGIFMGNRGILHDETQRIGRARWRHKAWIICELKHKDWHRDVMQPGNYTELFFLDEAVAMAAGHRPCALCRRKQFNSYRQSIDFKLETSFLDDLLHRERAVPRVFQQRRHQEEIESLPGGSIYFEEHPMLVLGDAVYPVFPDCYGNPMPRPSSGIVTVLTPKTTLKALRNGYLPKMHPSLSNWEN